MFIIYSKENCPNCEKARMFLFMKGKEVEVKKLDVDYDIEWYINEFKVRSFPVVVDTNTTEIYTSYDMLAKLVQ